MKNNFKNIEALRVLVLTMLCFYNINADAPQKILLDNQIVATVGPIKITVEEYLNGYEFGPAFIRQKANSKERYLNFMINEKLLALYGYEESFDKKVKFSNIHKEFVDDLATEEMFKELILPQIKISDEEVDTIITQKSIDVSVRWIYADSFKEITEKYNLIIEKNNFDSLFSNQFSDSVLIDERSMEKTRFQIGQRNPKIAEIIDTLEVGSISAPIKKGNEWYIVKLENTITNLFHTESEYNKLKHESVKAVKKNMMDIYSDEFVHNLLLEKNPIIKRDALNILKAYLGKHFLKKEVYDNWGLELKSEMVLKKMNLKDEEIPLLPLINMDENEITLNEFMIWFQNRSQYIKVDKSSYNNYSSSLEKLIWRMVRDNVLTTLALEKGYYEKEIVKQQSQWWREKITYSMVREQLLKAVQINNDEVKIIIENNNEDSITNLEKEFIRKLYSTLNLMKKKYPQKINNNVLEKISVTTENDPDEINIYFVKKNGLIPRQPYPTIDFEWGLWE